jgi:tetratricopeptide (TPR) repeat protein
VEIPTYEPAPPDKNPMFLEKRVYQGSSGRVYPLPFTDRIAEKPVPRVWEAVHLQNEYVRLMILPEIGGRIHVGLDRTNDYDFFYRQNVIKPALVGLAGPWISGGVEFNWPQHHRPSTFMRTDWEIEEHADGSITVWCSEHEPMNRMKGMHGVCLHPGRSVVELRVRLFNRTPVPQTFLWWANVGTRAHELYQSFFPPDVAFVADHAKRAMSRFPLCEEGYYGVDYGCRARRGVPSDEMPSQFTPRRDLYAPNDLSWYANIPVPTSYMAVGSKEDFFGGYDHAWTGGGAGIVHVADHRIAPGKKQWTWGNHEFGYAWDRNLTESDGPYIELMAGVFTDNQPDFSYLMPGETRTWSQYWYPIQKIGPALKANVDAALSLHAREKGVRVGAAVTRRYQGAQLLLERGETLIRKWEADLAPDRPLVEEVETRSLEGLQLRLLAEGKPLISYEHRTANSCDVPAPAQEPPAPAEVRSNEQLYLIGQHLEQYRHATRMPEAYWREAIRRDPTDTRCSNALGLWHLRRGEFTEARDYLERAVASLTAYNANPRDGEAFYNLGLACRFMANDERAYDAFAKAAWNAAWQAPALYQLAQLEARSGKWSDCLARLNLALEHDNRHAQAKNLKAIVLRKLGRRAEADALLCQTLRSDRLDAWASHQTSGGAPGDNQIRIDVAIDYAGAGCYREALQVLAGAAAVRDGSVPLVRYHQAFYLERLGEAEQAAAARKAAREAPADYCFPVRLEDLVVLADAVTRHDRDARAAYYLGNLLYDRRRQDEAVVHWEKAARLEPEFPTVWRNLGIAYFNVRRDLPAARNAYERAIAADPNDARLLLERDQLWKRLGTDPRARLGELEKHPELVQRRDDLSVELCALYNLTGAPAHALTILESRRFQPWEGGEGQVLGQYVRACLALASMAMADGDAPTAGKHVQAALRPPENLGEARHLLANSSDVYLMLGLTTAASGDMPGARDAFVRAARARGDFQEMRVRAFSETSYYSALALRALGEQHQAQELLRDLLDYAQALEKHQAKIDYFATSLPTMLLFEDDLQRREVLQARLMAAQAHLGMGNVSDARSLLEAIVAEDPSHALAVELLADLARAAGERSIADHPFDKLWRSRCEHFSA